MNFGMGLGQNFQQLYKWPKYTSAISYYTYLCKGVFSALTIIKAKCQLTEKKQAEDGLQTAVSNIQNGILHAIINKHIHVICMQIYIWLKNWLT